MDIRPIDRLILTMLADISKALNIKDGVDAELVHQAIFRDQLWALTWEFSGIFNEPETNPVVKETCDILDLWRRIDAAVAALSGPDREDVKKAASPFAMTFQGFDANNDPHYGVASFLVKHLNRFTERDPVPHSHSSGSLSHYRAMLGVAELFTSDTTEYPGLSKEQIVKVLRGGR